MDVVNETSVPFWTGVPAPVLPELVVPVGGVPVPLPVPLVGGAAVVPFSMTVATISVDPLAGTVVAVGNSVMTVPDGASSGTLSQAATNERAVTAVRTAGSAARRRKPRRRGCGTIRDAKDITCI
jgi:hypothetical protein